MTPGQLLNGTARRSRPSDRRATILAAATAAFSADGYHATKLSRIAEATGISTPALYRHFANKSELLAAVTCDMALRIAGVLESVPPRPDDPRGELAELIEGYVADVLNHRDNADLFRWEATSLTAEDRRYVRDIRLTGHRRVRALLQTLRPDLSRLDADVLTDAVFAVASSPASHRITMPRKAIVALMRDAALTVAEVDLPPEGPDIPSTGLSPAGRRESVLAAAVGLFADRGFHEVTVEDIGTASGLPPSGVYRHFPSKQAIVAAALERASGRVTAAIADGLAQAGSATAAVSSLARSYGRLCADDRAIITVYRRCFGALEPQERTALRRQQRANIDEWSTWLLAARPELSSAAARFLVHAALDTTGDLTGAPHPCGAARAAAVADAVLLRTAAPA